MIAADKRMNPQDFGSDPADIRINREIQIRIWYRSLALAECGL